MYGGLIGGSGPGPGTIVMGTGALAYTGFNGGWLMIAFCCLAMGSLLLWRTHKMRKTS